MRTGIAILAPLATLVFQPAAAAQEEKKYVTREEYEKLKAELEALKKAPPSVERDARSQEVDQEIEDLEKELKAVRAKADAGKPGTANFLLTGYGFAGFTDRERVDSTFEAGFNPIFLWRIDPRIFFEGEIELEIEDGEIEVALEYAHLTYLLGDYVTVGAGIFLAPFGTWAERFHPAWINKLPDSPLAFGHDGIAPTSLLGVQARGVIPLGDMRLNYAAYLANGPNLVIDDAEEAGMLDFENLTDLNNNKAAGGRLGFLPIPELEIGYSVMAARVDPSEGDVDGVDALLHSIDLTCVRDSDLLKGVVELRCQWVWSDVDDAVYDPSGASGFGPFPIGDNRRNGGYAQLAYRPSKSGNDILSMLEAVVRYDALEVPSDAAENIDERRWTIGLNCWLSPSTVLKVAYQLDDKRDPAGVEEDQDAVLFQAALGF